MSNRASLFVIMPTMAQAQSEFEGTFRCALINAMEAFQPDGRLHPVKAGSYADNDLFAPFRNFTVDVSRTGDLDIAGRTWTVVHTAAAAGTSSPSVVLTRRFRSTCERG
jgi:hypothetical protein